MQVLVPGGINDVCWNGILINTAYLHVKCTYYLKFSYFKIQMVCYRFVDIGLLHTFNTKHLVLYTLWYKYQTQTGKPFQIVFTGVYSLDLSVSTEKHSFMLEIIILNQTMKISKPCIYESS